MDEAEKAVDQKMDGFYTLALAYVEKECADELRGMRETSSPEYFQQLSVENFLEEYIWTVYAAGFKESILKLKFPKLKEAFENFSLDKICRMTTTAPVLAIINHTKKAESIIEGARLISKISFPEFKLRLIRMGPAALMELPYIGPVNKNQLARNIGLKSLAKDDVWMRRLVALSKSKDFEDMIDNLSQTFDEEPGVVDLILWRFCANNGWKSDSYSDLEKFYRSL